MESLSFQSVIKPLALSRDSKVELTFLMSILEIRTSTPHYKCGAGRTPPCSRGVRAIEYLPSDQRLDVGPEELYSNRLFE